MTDGEVEAVESEHPDHRDLVVEPGNVLNEVGFVVSFIWRHPANRGIRLRKLLQATLFQLKRRLVAAPSLAKIGDRSHLLVPPNVPSASRALYANPPDWPEMLVWKQHLRDGDLFIDVGANVGAYTVFALDLGAEVIAVEPSSRAAQLLRRNLDLNGYRAEVFEGAVADRSGRMQVTVGLDTGNHLVLSSLEGAQRKEVDVTTIDSLLGDRVAGGVKIDVEGAEQLVLGGAKIALSSQRIRMLQIEWSSASIELLGSDRRPIAELLTSFGYRIFRPNMKGELLPISDYGFGHDVFAKPAD